MCVTASKRALDGVPEVLVQQREVSRLKVSREAFPGGYRATGENDAAGHYIQDSAGCSASDVIAGSVLGSTLVESRQRKWVNKAGQVINCVGCFVLGLSPDQKQSVY